MTSVAEWLAALGLLAVGSSMVAGVYWLYEVAPKAVRDCIDRHHVSQERLRAYREILRRVVEINRICVGLSERHFKDQMERLAFGNDSDLDEPYEELAATYQSYYYVLDPTVREALSGYLDYLNKYHDDGPHVGRVLSKSGNVVAAMRSELDLGSIHPEDPKEE